MGQRRDTNIIKKTIDEATQMSYDLKILEADLDDAKRDIKAYAKKYNMIKIEGNTAFAKVTTTSKASVEPDELRSKLDDLQRPSEFMELIKVDLTQAKKSLGETVFEEIADIEIKPFNRVTLRPLK